MWPACLLQASAICAYLPCHINKHCPPLPCLPNRESAKLRGYLAQHAERKAAAAAREAREAAIMAAWPHGCPVGGCGWLLHQGRLAPHGQQLSAASCQWVSEVRLLF